MRIVVFLLVIGVGSMLLLSQWQSGVEGDIPGVQGPVNPGLLRQLEAAVVMAAAQAECGYTAVGYGQNTPSQAARLLVRQQNAALEPGSDAPGAARTPLRFTTESPTKAWQIQVIGDDQANTLTLKGFATDLHTPYLTRSQTC